MMMVKILIGPLFPLLLLSVFLQVASGLQSPDSVSAESETTVQQTGAAEPINLGSRRELFVDHFLIEKMVDADLKLHHPQPADSAIVFDYPWEGAFAGYATVIKDGDIYRMYYRGLPVAGADGSDVEVTCCAVSVDGIHWKKPELNIHSWNGSKRNNIVLMGETPASHNFAPFLDRNPATPEDQRYKALGGIETSGLIAFVSADGLHWRRMQEEPVFRKGLFDSQNVAFWSESEQQYVCYFRTWTGEGYGGFRTVSRTTSPDFIHWTDPQVIDFGDRPQEHLYTNQTTPYFRAPHLYIGLAARFMPGRRVITSADADRIGVVKRYSNDCSDTVLITSRGENVCDRTFMESFIRPGPGQENWVSRSNYAARGIVPTGDHELSMYMSRNYGQPTAYLQRYTLRTDGFASVNAGYGGGEMQTRLIQFPALTAQEQARKRADWRKRVESEFRLPQIEDKSPIRGSGSWRIEEPMCMALPQTQQLGETFTLAAMVRDVPQGHRRLFSAYNGGALEPGELLLDFNSGGSIEDGQSLRFYLGDFDLQVSEAVVGDWSIESGDRRPHHIAVTWNRGMAKLYFDGQLVAQKQQADAAPVELALGDLRFGEDYPPTSIDNEAFLGGVDDLLVLRRALEEVDICRLAKLGPRAVLDRQSDRGALLDFETGGVEIEGAEVTVDLSQRFENVIGPDVTWKPPFEFVGRHLSINMATSAAGSIRVEVQRPDGTPYPGFTIGECDEIVGDRIDQVVSWSGRSDLSQFANQPIRLRFVLQDADLYSIQFE